jgi:hypothetical protein
MFAEFTDFILQERIIQNVRVNWWEMKTGDLLVTRRWTGRSTAGMIQSGSLATHIALVAVMNGQSWVLEAQPDVFFNN